MPSGLFHLNSLDWSMSKRRSVWLFSLSPYFVEMRVLNAKSVDPDQTPRSDQGLHFLPVSLFWDAKHKLVYYSRYFLILFSGWLYLLTLTTPTYLQWHVFSIPYFGAVREHKHDINLQIKLKSKYVRN